ncbi:MULTISPECIES: hypothetical protein [unclassified Microbacterium]|uniref:hypothetical protein n=1 Tax=unclassified Microbacterium TaxID=2609290 RepID=UPI000EA8724C|nr:MULTISPECIES: hypothetical protein [unclassified Microbacterium]MBT2484642.1 hypothetical protein [Microbacterium sp. ISL-108]RKN67532.1 hypothetical protein D7252_08030 [Microbacterium sp. CGR2]
MHIREDTLDATIRKVLREELRSMPPSVPVFASFSQGAVAAAVRAELARANKHPADLTEVLGVSRPTVAGRLSGAYAFSVAELDRVALFLGIGAFNILESAMLGERFAATETSLEEQKRVFAPDAWAQPPRALAAQRRRAEGRRPGPH